MPDRFAALSVGLDLPASHGFVATLSDSTDLPDVTRAIFVGGSGAVQVVLASGAELTLFGVAAHPGHRHYRNAHCRSALMGGLGLNITNTALRPWWPADAVLAIDFVTGQAMRNRVICPLSEAMRFTRAPKSARTAPGKWQSFGVNVPAIADLGISIEPNAPPGHRQHRQWRRRQRLAPASQVLTSHPADSSSYDMAVAVVVLPSPPPALARSFADRRPDRLNQLHMAATPTLEKQLP